MINLLNGNITVYSLPLNYHPVSLSPYSIRLSENFQDLFGNTYINSGVLPAIIATADSLTNKKYLLLDID